MKKVALLLPALLFFTVSANAHGPVRQKMEKSLEINAPAAKVWGIIGKYEDMSWLPAIKSVKVDGDTKKGAIRVLTLKEGGTITEELKKHDDAKMMYSYKINDMSTAKTIEHLGQKEEIPVLPVHDYSASIEVESTGADKSVVIWKAGYYRAYMNNLTLEGEPKEMNEEVANKAVSDIFDAGLANIKALAEK